MAVLVGPQGATGPRGLQGLVGPRGIPGAPGLTGAAGRDGARGLRGERGPMGLPGLRGERGLQGERGRDGQPGRDGSIAGIEHDLNPNDVGSGNAPGAGLTAAAYDHTHKGVRSFRAGTDPQLFGNVVLAEGTNVTLNQTGNTITVSAASTSFPSGPAGGDLDGTYPNPIVVAIHETSGPTKLTLGAVSDGEFLKRVGTTIVSAEVHGTIHADSINTSGTKLSTVNASQMEAGQLAWVDTVDAHFELIEAALTTDGITVIAANSLSGFQWHRIVKRSLVWEARTTWYVDPANVSTTASDENTGLTSITPLLSFGELSRRMYGANFPSGTINVTLMSNTPASDPFHLREATSDGFVTIVITGTPTTIVSGRTIASPRNPALTANDHFEITDAAGVSGFVQNYLLERTNGTPAYWWGYKDLGSNKLHISPPLSAGLSILTLSNGDTYKASSLPDFADAWVEPSTFFLQVKVVKTRLIGAAFYGASGAVGGIVYDRCIIANPFSGVFGGDNNVINVLENVCVPASAATPFSMLGRTSVFGGLFAGDGTTSSYTLEGGYMGGGNPSNVITLGGAVLSIIHDARFEKAQFMIYDWAGGDAAIIPRLNAYLYVQKIGGERNTSQIMRVETGGRAYGDSGFTNWNSTITTHPTPYQVNGTNYTAADLGVGTNHMATRGGGIIDQVAGVWGGDLSGLGTNPSVVAIHETSGPTQLTIGAVNDGEFLKRVGATLVSATTPTPTLTATQVAYGDGSNLMTSDSNLTWDATNKRLTVTTSASALAMTINATSSTGYAEQAFINNLGAGSRGSIYYTGSAYPGAETYPNSLAIGTAGGASSHITFSPNNTLMMDLLPTKATFGGASTGLVFDASNNQMTIGNASPIAAVGFQYNKNTNSGVVFLFSNPNTGGSAYSSFQLAQSATLASGANFGQTLLSSGSTFGVPYTANSIVNELAGSTGNFVNWIDQASGDYLWYTGTTFPNPDLRMKLTNAGALSVPNLGSPGGYVKADVTTGLLSSVATIPTSGVSLTATQIAYGDGSNLMTSEAALAYDATNNLLKLGSPTTSTTDEALRVNRSVNDISYVFTGSNPNSGDDARIGMRLFAGAEDYSSSYLDISLGAGTADNGGILTFDHRPGDDGEETRFMNSGANSGSNIAFYTAGAERVNIQWEGVVNFPSSNGSGVVMAFTKAGAQSIEKQGSGSFFVGTLGAQILGLYTNNTTRLSIASGGAVSIVDLGTPGGYVKAAGTTGLLSSVATIPYGDITGGPTDLSGMHFVTTQAESGLSAEFSLGSLSTGVLQHTVSGSVSTPSSLAVGTSLIPYGDGSNLLTTTSTFGYNASAATLAVGIAPASVAAATSGHFKRNDPNGNNLYIVNPNAGVGSYMGLTIGNNDTIFTGPYFGFWQTGASFTPVGNANASAAWFQLGGGSGNMFFDLHQNAGDYVFTTGTSPSEKMRLYNGGDVTIGGATTEWYYRASGTKISFGNSSTMPTGSQFQINRDRNSAVYLNVTNPNAGTAAEAGIILGNSATAYSGYLYASFLGAGYTTTGPYHATGAAIEHVTASATAPLFFSAYGPQAIEFYTTTSHTLRMKFQNDGAIEIPSANAGDLSLIFTKNDDQAIEKTGSDFYIGTGDNDSIFFYTNAINRLQLTTVPSMIFYNVVGADSETLNFKVGSGTFFSPEAWQIYGTKTGSGNARSVQVDGLTQSFNGRGDTAAYIMAGPNNNNRISATGIVGSEQIQLLAYSEKASSTSMAWNGISMTATGLYVTGTTHVTTATGVNFVNIAAVDYDGESTSKTIDYGASLRIAGPPNTQNGITLTNPYALWVDAGETRLDGRITGGADLNLNGVSPYNNSVFVLGHTNDTSRDHVMFFVGGGDNQDAPNNQFFAIYGGSTALTGASYSGTGILSTVHMETGTYSPFSGSPSITAAVTLYIKNAPTLSSVTGDTLAMWVDAGRSRFDGDGTHVFELPADATGNTTNATGRIPIKVGGATKYIRYFDS